jgi:type IV fimbrial biogenesis protein FimT
MAADRRRAAELLGHQEEVVLMKTPSGSKSAGFTLIELMIGVAILGTLVAVGLPSFTQMLRNSQVRGAAESVANGIQRARAEAVAHNSKVQFTLAADTSWYVDYVATPNAAARLDSRDNTSSAAATITVLPAAATTITFNQLGQVVSPNPADGSLPLTQVSFAATGSNLNLRVTIGAGGNAKVCDPSLPTSNVRAC